MWGFGQTLPLGAERLFPSRWREGGGAASFIEKSFEFVHNAVDIPEDIIVPEADDAVTLAFEKGGSAGVGVNVDGMLTPINLDNDLFGPGDEIANERPNRNLAVESDSAQLAVAEDQLQALFCSG